MMTATYSAEDNKIRLYVGRVPRDEYERLRAALLAVKALWDKHGLGDEDAESEPVYAQLCAALK